MSTRDGGPAFPRPVSRDDDGASGMTLRDYFAAAAMPLIAIAWNDTPRKDGVTVGQHAAEMAYTIAERMLAERAKNEAR